jgi:hypothetical protein
MCEEKTVSFTASISVQVELNGTTKEEVKDRLSRTLQALYDDGMLTGDSSNEVIESYNIEVTELDTV